MTVIELKFYFEFIIKLLICIYVIKLTEKIFLKLYKNVYCKSNHDLEYLKYIDTYRKSQFVLKNY